MEKFLYELSKQDREKLDALAKDMDRSRSSVLRTLVRREYARRFNKKKTPA